MPVGNHSSAPVAHFRRFDAYSAELDALSPCKFMHCLEPADQILIPRLNHHRDLTPKEAQGSQIGMVHVGVGEKQDVEAGKLARPESRLDQPPRAQFCQTSPNADALLERRIGQQPGAAEVEEHRGMSQP